MDKQLETVLELSRDPMLALEDRRIVYANNAAAIALPELKPGRRAAEYLPEQILSGGAGRFVASANVIGKVYTVSGCDSGNTRLLSFVSRSAAEPRGLLSDGLINDLLTTLFNAGLSADRITAALEETADPSLARFLSLLRHSHFSLQRQLTNLRLAVQLREGSVYFAPRRTDLVARCAALTADVAALVRDSSAVPEFSSQLPELCVWADPQLIEKLLLNLLSNSLAHTPADGEVRVRVQTAGDNAVISVDDTGEGIPPDVLQNVFARYEQQLDGAHLDRGMTAGLGLGVSGGIARLHGGTLVIESREGRGTSVRAMLPLNQPDVELLEGGDSVYDGMNDILTELSGILSADFYAPKYLD